MGKDNFLYFFSALAQCWAALVAFGGMYIRERIHLLGREINELFKETSKVLRDRSTLVGLNHWSLIFKDVDRFFEYLENDFDEEALIAKFRDDERLSIGGSQWVYGREYKEEVANLKNYVPVFKILKEEKEALVTNLYHLLSVGFFIIFLSLILLFFANNLKENLYIAFPFILLLCASSGLGAYIILKSFLYKIKEGLFYK